MESLPYLIPKPPSRLQVWRCRSCRAHGHRVLSYDYNGLSQIVDTDPIPHFTIILSGLRTAIGKCLIRLDSCIKCDKNHPYKNAECPLESPELFPDSGMKNQDVQPLSLNDAKPAEENKIEKAEEKAVSSNTAKTRGSNWKNEPTYADRFRSKIWPKS
jgi:hypothetical protein